jgi:lipopolysaccharide export LptBFGC system permease protein LptF
MSRTLFWYIFRDLLRIFLLASGVLSAIMSFGGLLKPLYEFGLDISQVGAILGWSGPAMTAYSLPIAALFATTIVYGRFGADNEITACRAAGISFFVLSVPALVLGLLTAFVGLFLLCFVVPASMLKVERIVYTNLAELVGNQIERTHQIRFNQADRAITVFAQKAEVLPVDPKHPRNQAVQLYGPMIVEYESTGKGQPLVPKDFYMAQRAVAYIRQEHEDDDVTMSAFLEGGTKFPRDPAGPAQNSFQLSVGTTRFGPVPLPSPVRENTKFMDIFKLQGLLNYPEQSRRIRDLTSEFDRRDQEQQYLNFLAEQLNGPGGAVELTGSGETYQLIRGSAMAEVRKDRLVIGGELGGTPARLLQVRATQNALDVEAKEIRVRAFPDTDRKRIELDLDMYDAVVTVAGTKAPHGNFSRPISVPMPGAIFSLHTRLVSDYMQGLSKRDHQRLNRDLQKLTNSVISELHARMSFAVSCFMLVMVGCALGMMFRSGDFLSAFAISVIPALATIALIVAGQQTAQNVPWNVDVNFRNPLSMGLILIWSGNAANLAAALVLLGRLQRK